MCLSRGSEWNRWDLHVHTASSYDYKYRGDDADDLLCKSLLENGIRAVAITDHFIIDKERIKNLRKIAPEITFFPGVELRTDKGANNLHLILFFSDDSDIDVLSADFDAIMLRDKAKSCSSNDTIYWTFTDIVEFAKKHDALISIHAGKKSNGIDSEITNAVPFKEAIKIDIAANVDFFEIGKKSDINGYENHVFKDIDRKPLIMCSDNHDPRNYSTKENLWIKADLTFEGLKQCLYQPLERVYIGVIPPMIDRLYKNRQANIDSIYIKRVDKPKNASVNWFNAEIPINPGMTAIIGNKGTGKSALSDIIGHLCKCNTMRKASFLNADRFRKQPKNYAGDYIAKILWADGDTRKALLSEEDYVTTIEDAQYLPQKFIEDTCNDINNVFQDEIDKVIFSYIDRTERGESQNLHELVRQKSRPIELNVQADFLKIQEINTQIIKLEHKLTKSYKKKVSDSLKKAQETLIRHDKSKPKEVKKPEPQEANVEYLEKLQKLNDDIKQKQNSQKEIVAKISTKTTLIDEVTAIIAEIESLESQFISTKRIVDDLIDKYQLDIKKAKMALKTPKEYLIGVKDRAIEDKRKFQDTITNPEHGLAVTLKKLEEQKKILVATADNKEKLYQKYLYDLDEWNKRRNEIIGDKDTEDTLDYFKCEQDYLEKLLQTDYDKCVSQRDDLTRKLYNDKAAMLSVYQSIYTPIQGEVTELLGDIENNVTFKAELFMCEPKITEHILSYIDQRMRGKFGKSKDADQTIEKFIQKTDFNDSESVLDFIHFIVEDVTDDLEQAEKKIDDRQAFYDFLYGLNYIGVDFKLKMGERNLNELSPGERGIVLMMFYLALSKESKPIIIDQPEDNLDNQSVYSKLVPCICKAKQKRQVIIVTHNPNIAVACDAEQIVFCEMDKSNYQIRYTAGSIENPEIKKHVVDVLEGTKPAFDLRKKKYD